MHTSARPSRGECIKYVFILVSDLEEAPAHGSNVTRHDPRADLESAAERPEVVYLYTSYTTGN